MSARLNETTRRFPRTSQAEPWRGVWEPHRASFLHRWQRPLSCLLAGAMGVWLAVWMFAWWSS